MKYKIGDKVTLTNGNTMTKDQIDDISKWYRMREDPWNCYTDEMIEGLVEEETQPKFKVGDRVITNKGYIGKFEGWVSDYQVKVLFEESGCDVVIHPKDLKLMEEETKSNVIEETKNYWDSIKDAWICPEGYQFKDENGNVINATKIVLEKKKKEYPKTYEECEKVLRYDSHRLDNMGVTVRGYKWELNRAFQILLICRDAYWKIAGEEMGLGKPWEPDWYDEEYPDMYYISYDGKYLEKGNGFPVVNMILIFPTAEMRDAFKENFDTDIEICKELL